MYLGKKIYHSRALPSIKLIVISIATILLFNLIFQTYKDPAFVKLGDESVRAVLRYHWYYPEELIIYLLTIFIPTIYYGFIRGIRFFEKGVIFNRGLPFFNTTILYKDIEKYEIVHPKYLLSIKQKVSEDVHMFGLGNIDRALAILDQSDIQGDLGSSTNSDHKAKKKLILYIVLFGVAAAIVQHFGLVRLIFR